jgi:hypothetical protein
MIFQKVFRHIIDRALRRKTRMCINLCADDAIIFSNAVRAEVAFFCKLWNHLAIPQVEAVTPSKLSVARIRCQGFDLDNVLHDFASQHVGFPMTYLGLPITLGRLRKVHL